MGWVRRGRMAVVAVAAFVAAATLSLGDTAEAKLLSAADKKLYQDAFKQVDKENWSKARDIADRAKEGLPAKFIQWLDLTRPGPGRSFEEITDFMLENPDWPGQATLQEQGERAMTDGLGPDLVIDWFAGREPRTAEGAMRLGFALMRKGEMERGVAILRNAWANFPMQRPVENQFLASFGTNLRPQDHWARLDRLLWERESEAARRELKRVDAEHRLLGEARLKLIDGASDARAAIQKVPAALKNDPGLLYDQVRLLRVRDDNIAAAALLDPPPATSAYPDKMWREFEWQARRALDRGDAALAYRLAEAHGTEGGSTFADGEWLAGWIALRYLGDEKLGYQHFTRLYEGVTSTISRGRGAYWAGRAAEAMGDAALATDWYRKAAQNLGSYYGQLGAERLGSLDGLGLPTLPKLDEAAKQTFTKNELVRLVRMMAELEQTDRVRSFLVRLAEAAESPAEFRMLAELGKEIGRADFGVAVAKVARQQGIELVDFLYPTTKLPAGDTPEDALVLAVIRQESAFDRKAESPAGALGLMQLLPRTAKHIAKSLGLAFSEKKLTSDSQYNIKIGRAYLADLIDSYGGSYLLAAASYNAGPSRVKEWISTYGDPRDANVDTVDWVESIPFSETRNYVQRVLENLQIYRHRLEGGTEIALSLERDLSRPSQP